MSELHAPAHLAPVPADEPVGAAAADFTGITPPRRRGGAARFITDVIVELGFAAEGARRHGRRGGHAPPASRPRRCCVESGALASDQLARATAERFGLDHVDLTLYKPDLAAVEPALRAAARRYNAIPIGFHQSGQLLVAMADPSNVLALDDLKLMTGYEVRPVVASREDIARSSRR